MSFFVRPAVVLQLCGLDGFFYLVLDAQPGEVALHAVAVGILEADARGPLLNVELNDSSFRKVAFCGI